MSVGGTATGGSGGSVASGNGSAGTPVSLSNAVDGQTSGPLYINQTAIGGNGGGSASGNGGQGGSAKSRLTVSKASSFS